MSSPRHRLVPANALEGRGRSLLGVGLAFVALVGLNSFVRPGGGSAPRFAGTPSLPVVQLGRPSAWRCPGPLPVGAGAATSRIAIVNAGASATSVIVSVTRTTASAGGISSGSSVAETHVELDADSEAMVPLPVGGPRGWAAVSVDSQGDGIGVSEMVGTSARAVGAVWPASPCTLGASPTAYLPVGTTSGSSDVLFGLYDPNATPAVVDLSISNGSGLSSPPAFQGVVVPADGVVVLDLRRWAFQVATLAVTAQAVSGDVVAGALETTARLVSLAPGSSGGLTRGVNLVGTSLLVAPGSGLSDWELTALQSRLGVSSMFSVYDPGRSAVTVSVAPPGREGAVAALTEQVPAGGVVDFATPITPVDHLSARSVLVSAGKTAQVVVARLTTRQTGPKLLELDSTAGSSKAARTWLLPGATTSRHVEDTITLVDPGPINATVALRALYYGPRPHLLGTVEVLAGTERDVELGGLVKGPATFALEVSTGVPILAEQQLRPSHGQVTAEVGMPVEP